MKKELKDVLKKYEGYKEWYNVVELQQRGPSYTHCMKEQGNNEGQGF